jgi:hypothetical protein
MSLPLAAPAAPDPALAYETAREYLNAVRAEGFAAQARFMHPEELARFQKMLLPAFEANQAEGSRVLLNATFGRESSLTDARLAEPADFMSRFVRVMAVRMPDQPIGFDALEVLGGVGEGVRMHVLIRLRTGAGDASVETLEVVSLMPEGDEWRLMLSPQLESAARSMNPSGQPIRPIPRLEPRALPPDPGTSQPADEAGLETNP